MLTTAPHLHQIKEHGIHFSQCERNYLKYNILSKICMFVKACDICQGTKIKSIKIDISNSGYLDYTLMESLTVGIKSMPKGSDDFKYL